MYGVGVEGVWIEGINGWELNMGVCVWVVWEWEWCEAQVHTLTASLRADFVSRICFR